VKTITMTELRAELGERIRDVRKGGESFLITKDGTPAAKLVPVGGAPLLTDEGELPLDVRHLRRGAGY
jgi:prevent-host-death family protein